MPRSRKSRTRKLLSRLRKLWFRSLFTRIFVAISVLLVVLVVAYFYQFTETRYYTLVGKPSISAEFINRVLAWYDSPAAGKGQALYDDGVKYGIDPVYALAFFMHESRFGRTGVATVTHSLGNIRATAGHARYQGYRMYRTWEEGFEDWYRLIA